MNYTLVSTINLLFQIFSFLILVEVIGSWLLVARLRLPSFVYSLLSAVHAITAPILNPIRRLIPGMGGLDLSPIIALILIDLLRTVVVRALLGAV